MKYVLGLDIGISSVGWATLEVNTEDEPFRILDLGSRIFERAEIPKTGESLALPRRTARGSRRRLRRRRFRVLRVKRYLIRNQILTKEQLQALYTHSTVNIVALRKEGLYRLLTPSEWAKILIYMAKHRGFKSNRKSTAVAGEDDGIVLKAIKANERLVSKYKTVGEMLHDDKAFAAHKRNKGDSYLVTVSRQMLLDEIKLLYSTQRAFQNPFATQQLEQEYMDIFSSQRNFDEGPACGPYSGNQIEHMIGQCTFERDEKRAPKASYAFMAFNLWQKINHLRYKTTADYHGLDEAQRQKLYELAWKKETVTYKDIRNELALPEEARFKDVSYSNKETPVEREKKVKFAWVKEYHSMRKALDKVHKNRITELSSEQIDTIAFAFSVYKNDAAIETYLRSHQIEEADCSALLQNLKTFSKFGHLSAKACYAMLPYLEKGNSYYDACTLAGYDFQASSQGEIEDIPNPVVKRAISQTMKVIKAIVQRYGCAPVEIHVELARDMARNYADRQKMQRNMEDNQSKNEKIRAQLKEYGVLQPTGQDIVKFKLYQQQDGRCMYSLKSIDLQRLLHEPDYAEVDHIIPYSRSMDDSYRNKVLVLTAENRQKGNKTPLEYLKRDEARRADFITWVTNHVKDGRKRDHLLMESYGLEKEKEWKDRQLNDTRYISRFIFNYLRIHFDLEPGYTPRKRRILAVNGAVTAYIRKRLGIPKIRENGDLHHAVDAVIIATATQGVIQRITRYSKIKELQQFQDEQGHIIDRETGEILNSGNTKHKAEPFPEPWPSFRKELQARVSDQADEAIKALHLATYEGVDVVKTPFVSRMPNHKVTGQAHEETIKSPKLKHEGYSIVKTDLANLKLDTDGEISNYYHKESDKLLYEALKKRLAQYGGKGKDAFAKPFYKPKADGTQGPLVKKVKVMEKTSLNVDVYQQNGIAKNGDMVRVDIFGVEERGKTRYYIVPIYVSDTVKNELPNKAIVAHKPYDEWPKMKDEDFLFSLYPNDLIYVKHPSGMNPTAQKGCDLIPPKNMKEAFFYYKGCNIRNGTCVVENPDNTFGIASLGIKTLVGIDKYNIDVLGTIHKVKKEKRMTFHK